jgi:hypothetical protein
MIAAWMVYAIPVAGLFAGAAAALDGEDVLPGFVCSLAGVV